MCECDREMLDRNATVTSCGQMLNMSTATVLTHTQYVHCEGISTLCAFLSGQHKAPISMKGIFINVTVIKDNSNLNEYSI